MKNTKNVMRFGLMILSLFIICSESSAQSWSLSGNAATDPNTMFMGTTDLKALRFRTNNQVRMAISNTGKIGVGTQTPVFKFDLRGGSYNTDSLYRINGVPVLVRDNSNRIQLGDGTVKVGIGTSTPSTALQVAGTVTATDFSGGGGGLTSLNAGNISSGTLSDSRLSSNVPKLNGTNNFSNNNSFMNDILVKGVSLGAGGGGFTNNTAVGYIALQSNIAGGNNTAIGSVALNLNTFGVENTSVGAQSMANNTEGNHNTATGTYSLSLNTLGNRNAAFGRSSLYQNTTGNDNTAQGYTSLLLNTTGSKNTAVGSQAMTFNDTGEENTAVGFQSLYRNTSGFSNTGVGTYALQENTTGFSNTANGWGALRNNTTGNFNTASGVGTLNVNTTGSENTASGTGALSSNTTGSFNTAIGRSSLNSNTIGFYNTAVGSGALYANTTGEQNTAVGFNSLSNNTTGYYNTGVGLFSLSNNTTANSGTAVGFKALFANTTGVNNSALGSLAMSSNTTGIENTANGANSLQTNTIGSYNTACGTFALNANTTGTGNSAFGNQTLLYNSTGEFNTAIGKWALYSDISSSNNTALGFSAGDYQNNGSNNTFLGAGCWAAFNGLSNTSSLGYNTRADASNKVRIGNTAITSIGGQVGWTTFSDGRYKRNVEEDVPGLDFISKLRPVTYTTDINGLDNHYPKPTPREGQVLPELGDVSEQEKIRYSGFIAQEVEAAAKEIGYDFSGVDKPQKEGNLYGIRYAEFVVPMVKAIQEQQKQIEELKAALASKNNSGAIKLGVNDSNDEILLGQNIPNPADNSTIIPFSIPATCKSASILITDHATGRAIKAVPLSCKDTHLMLDAGSLASGTYSYTLFVDGASFDTKQMVIVK